MSGDFMNTAKPFPGDVLEDMGGMQNITTGSLASFRPNLAAGRLKLVQGWERFQIGCALFVDQLDLIEPDALAERLREKVAGDDRCTVAEQTLELDGNDA